MLKNFVRGLSFFWDGGWEMRCKIAPGNYDFDLEVFANAADEARNKIHVASVMLAGLPQLHFKLILPEGCTTLDFYVFVTAEQRLKRIACVRLLQDSLATVYDDSAESGENVTNLYEDTPALGPDWDDDDDDGEVQNDSAGAATGEDSGENPCWHLGLSLLDQDTRSTQPFSQEQSGGAPANPAGPLASGLITQYFRRRKTAEIPASFDLIGPAVPSGTEHVTINARYRRMPSPAFGEPPLYARDLALREPARLPVVDLGTRTMSPAQLESFLLSVRLFHISAQCLALRALNNLHPGQALPFQSPQEWTQDEREEDGDTDDEDTPRNGELATEVFGSFDTAGGFVAHVMRTTSGGVESDKAIGIRQFGPKKARVEFREASLGDEIGYFLVESIQGLSDLPRHRAWRLDVDTLAEQSDQAVWTRLSDICEGLGEAIPPALEPFAPSSSTRLKDAWRLLDEPERGEFEREGVSAYDTTYERARRDAKNAATWHAGDGSPWDTTKCLAERWAFDDKLQGTSTKADWPANLQETYFRLVRDSELSRQLNDANFRIGPSNISPRRLRLDLKFLHELLLDQYKSPIDATSTHTKEYVQAREAGTFVDLANFAEIVRSLRKCVEDGEIARAWPNKDVKAEMRNSEMSDDAKKLAQIIDIMITSPVNAGNRFCLSLQAHFSGTVKVSQLTLNELRKLKQDLDRSRAKDPTRIDGNAKLDIIAQALGIDRPPQLSNVAMHPTRPSSQTEQAKLVPVLKVLIPKTKVEIDDLTGDTRYQAEMLAVSAAYRKLEGLLDKVAARDRPNLRRKLSMWPINALQTWQAVHQAASTPQQL
jgi:hypothetical protein